MAQAVFALAIDGRVAAGEDAGRLDRDQDAASRCRPPCRRSRRSRIASPTALKRERAEAIALERAKQLAAEAKGGDFAAAAKKAGATTGETPRFSLAKPAEKLPGDAMLAAFQTATGATSPSP